MKEPLVERPTFFPFLGVREGDGGVCGALEKFSRVSDESFFSSPPPVFPSLLRPYFCPGFFYPNFFSRGGILCRTAAVRTVPACLHVPRSSIIHVPYVLKISTFYLVLKKPKLLAFIRRKRALLH